MSSACRADFRARCLVCYSPLAAFLRQRTALARWLVIIATDNAWGALSIAAKGWSWHAWSGAAAQQHWAVGLSGLYNSQTDQMKRALREIADHNTAGSNDAPATASGFVLCCERSLDALRTKVDFVKQPRSAVL